MRYIPAMNKLFPVFVFLCLLASPADGQRKRYPQSYWGIYGGFNLSGMGGNYVANVPGNSGKIRPRWQAGIYSNQNFNRNLSLFFALDLVFKGGITKGFEYPAGNEIPYKAKTNLSYLSLPVMINYTPRPDWGIMIGPQADYLIQASEPWYKSEQYRPVDYKENVRYKYKDLGLSGTIAFNYLLQNGVIFQIRYSQNILTATHAEYGETRNYSIMFYIGMNFWNRY